MCAAQEESQLHTRIFSDRLDYEKSGSPSSQKVLRNVNIRTSFYINAPRTSILLEMVRELPQFVKCCSGTEYTYCVTWSVRSGPFHTLHLNDPVHEHNILQTSPSRAPLRDPQLRVDR